MAISFSCGQCGKDYVVSDGLAGKSAICKACGARMTVPGGTEAGVDVPPPAQDDGVDEVAPLPSEMAPGAGTKATAPAASSFRLSKAPSSGKGGPARMVWLVVIVAAAVAGGLRGMNTKGKSTIQAFFQRVLDLDRQTLASLKSVKDLESARTASAPLNDALRQKLDHIEKNRKTKGRKENIAAVAAEFKPQIEAVQNEIGVEALRVRSIPGVWDALDIKEPVDRLEKIDEEVTKEAMKP